jgi:hypothetical protein
MSQSGKALLYQVGSWGDARGSLQHSTVATPLVKSHIAAKNKYVRATRCYELAFILLLATLSETILRSWTTTSQAQIHPLLH